MNLRTRLSRSNGYRELGMYDESILKLENILDLYLLDVIVGRLFIKPVNKSLKN